MVALTIGMPTYNDFDGVYFTIQSLRYYQDLEDTELLVIDNYGCETTRDFVEGGARSRYVRATDAVGTAAAKNLVFTEAKGRAVLCCDSHVMFPPGTIARLKAYYQEHPETNDLLQGPLVYDDLQNVSTHFDPVWRGQMWGIWGTDARALDPEGEPFEIWGQGMGVFSCRRKAWPGFNPAFRGFGGEEGYIHEKVRQRGGRVLCLPWLRWGHRFGRPNGVPYTLTVEDKLRNYIIGYTELGLDVTPVLEHFAEHMHADIVVTVADQVLREHLQESPGKKKPKARPRRGKQGSEATQEQQNGDANAPPALIPAVHSGPGDAPETRIGVLTPTHDRPHMVRALVTQMALQERKPDILCIHQNGDPDSYQWAIEDLTLPFVVKWIHTSEKMPQEKWYSRPLKALLDDGCTHFFWCDDDDIYLSNHVDRTMDMLTDKDDPRDFVINGYCGMLLTKKAGYAYLPCERFSAHDPGGMSSSMAFNRAFAEELYNDLRRNNGKLYFADHVVSRVTMPKFRCKLDERQTPSTIYVCHPGTHSSSHWLGNE